MVFTLTGYEQGTVRSEFVANCPNNSKYEEELRNQLIHNGFEMLGQRALNHLLELGTITEIIEPLNLEIPEGQDPEDILFLGPTKVPNKNPGVVGIWAVSQQYFTDLDRQKNIEHVRPHFGYSLGSKPAKIPMSEKEQMAKDFIDKGLIPVKRARLIKSGQALYETTALEAVSNMQIDTDDIVEKLAKVRDERIILGPYIVDISEDTVRIHEGPHVSAWRMPHTTKEELRAIVNRLKLHPR